MDNALRDLWDGPTATYAFPAAPMQMAVVSSSASDTAAGTGARSVHIHYLDAEYQEQFETVTLNGATPVNTAATDIRRINGMHSWTVGSGGVPAGNISIRAVGGAVTYGYILAGLNMARQAIFTVPAGKRLKISHWQVSSGSTGEHFCTTTIRATTHAGVLLPGVFLVQDEAGSQNGGGAYDFAVPRVVPATADIKVSSISDSVSANVISLSAFSGWLEAL